MNNFVSMSDYVKFTQGQIKTSKEDEKREINSSFSKDTTVQNVSNQNTLKNTATVQSTPVVKQTKDTFEINLQFEKAKKQNGLIEKIADKIKGLTGLGLSSKKIQDKINQNTDEATITQDIKNYRAQQENIAQAVADTLSCASSIAVFFGIKQNFQKLIAKYWTINNGFSDQIKEFFSSMKDEAKGKKFIQNIQNFANKHLDKKSTALIAATVGAMWIGSFIKKNLLKINRIGTSQYKPTISEDMDKVQIKKAKKEAKKAKKNANRRNSLSGAINGLMTPLLAFGGGLTAPVYIIGNFLNRYFIANREDKGHKSFKSFIENIKQTQIMNTLSAVLIAIPAIKKGRADKIFEKNLKKATEKLKVAKLEQTTSSVSTYKQLENILFDDDTVKGILSNDSISTSEKIKQLSEYNIFAVKFKQINPSMHDDLAKALKTECPPTRTLEEAQELIRGTFGGKYDVKKCVGVGTVAETYLATDKSGADVCIKMLKKGIDGAKIDRDADKFIEMINGLEGKTQEEKDFLIKNISNIAQGVRGEIDLSNEMTAAQDLAKVTHRVNVVKPIEVSNNIYVMEKARGVNLSDFTTFMEEHSWRKDSSLESLIEKLQSDQKNLETSKNNLAIYDQYIDWYNELVKKHPELDDSDVYFCSWELPKEIQESDELKKAFDAIRSVKSESRWTGWDEKTGKSIYIKGKEAVQKQIADRSESIKSLAKYIELRQDKNFTSISADETQKMYEAYQDALVEQFYKIDGTQKIIHGDIHPGNVFIDLEALKRGDSKFLTLIDTGNTIQQSPETALRMLNLTKYIENADTENIVDFVLEGAKLPEGLTKDKARKAILDELNKAFFDDKTELDTVTTQSLLGITDDIMRKLNIIPSDTQGNLLKSKQSAHQSLIEFMQAFSSTKMDEVQEQMGDNMKANALKEGSALKKIYSSITRYAKKQKKQEKLNLKAAQAKGRVNLQKSPSAPKKNSEEYLTYYLKQGRMGSSEDMEKMLQRKIYSMLGLN